MTFWHRLARWFGFGSDVDEPSSNEVPKVRSREPLLTHFDLPEGVAAQGSASEQAIRQFEKLIDARLPDDYRAFLREYDGAVPSDACDWTISTATLDAHPTGKLDLRHFQGLASVGKDKLGSSVPSLRENVSRRDRPFRDTPWRHIVIGRTSRGALFMSLRRPNFGACYVSDTALVDYFASGFGGTMTRVLYHESTYVASSFSELWTRSAVHVSEQNAQAWRDVRARFPTIYGRSAPVPEDSPDEPEPDPDRADEVECAVYIVEVEMVGVRRYFAVPYRDEGDASDYVAAVASEVVFDEEQRLPTETKVEISLHEAIRCVSAYSITGRLLQEAFESESVEALEALRRRVAERPELLGWNADGLIVSYGDAPGVAYRDGKLCRVHEL